VGGRLSVGNRVDGELLASACFCGMDSCEQATRRIEGNRRITVAMMLRKGLPEITSFVINSPTGLFKECFDIRNIMSCLAKDIKSGIYQEVQSGGGNRCPGIGFIEHFNDIPA
jgi:hypothetical protein